MMFNNRIQVLQSAGMSPRLAQRVADQPGPIGSVDIKAQDNTAEVLLYDFIGFDWWSGDGITAKQFTQDIASLGKLDSLTLRINSPGGDVFDGFAMYNILTSLEYDVRVEIDSIAASAASVVAMAGNSINMYETSQFMIHDAWAGVIGNEQDLREMADVLQKIDGQIADVYAKKAKKTDSETFRALMNKDTYLTPKESLDIGLADMIIGTTRPPAAEAATHAARNRMAQYLAIERQRLGC